MFLESLKIELQAQGKVSQANPFENKSAKQSVANPVIQQLPSCRLCSTAQDPSQCPAETAKLKAGAAKRGTKFPGTDKSTRRNSPRQRMGTRD